MTLTTGIERIRIRNYRVLQDVELNGLTAVTALLGPNGSGKSTLLDAIRFLLECFDGGLVAAWERRGGLPEIRSQGASGPVEIELGCRIDDARADYRMVVEERGGALFVAEERLTWQAAGQDSVFTALELRRGEGVVHRPGSTESVELIAEDLVGVRTFGQLAANAEIAAFLRFVSRFQLFDLDVTRMRDRSRNTGAGARLTPSGSTIAAMVQELREHDHETWTQIAGSLRRYVPGLEDVIPIEVGESYLVGLKMRQSESIVLPESISDGTLRMLGYLVALRDPASVLLFEEPENQVHPRLHYMLAEEARATRSDQIVVATHAPRFVDALKPGEVWNFALGADDHTEVLRASDEPRLVSMVESGAALGDLWTEGYFRFGDPLAERT